MRKNVLSRGTVAVGTTAGVGAEMELTVSTAWVRGIGSQDAGSGLMSGESSQEISGWG